MKIFLKRFSAVCIAILVGSTLFLSLLKAGSTSKGPLEDILTTVHVAVARQEKSLTALRDSRSSSLAWFNRLRHDKAALNKTEQIILGAYDDMAVASYENIVSLEDSLKTKLPIISIYAAWGSNKDQMFPLIKAQAIYDLGSIPMITWEPWLNDFDSELFPSKAGAANKNKGGLKAIAEGAYDAYIDKWAVDAAEFGMPFFVRFGHEMNDPYRYPWSQQNNTPEQYIAAWQHIVKRFRALGANQVIWVWSPHPAYATYAQFYPGSEYVDWVGVTALNYGTVANWSQWWSFNQISKKSYEELALYDKPIMLTEFGSLAVGGDRAKWFKEALSSLPVSYPKVKAVVFYHAENDNTTSYKDLNWSFDNDKEVLNSIIEGMQSWEANKNELQSLSHIHAHQEPE